MRVATRAELDCLFVRSFVRCIVDESGVSRFCEIETG